MSTRSTRRESPAVNAGSMADIAFLLLIFFLVTTTIAEDSGMLVRLPPWTPEPPEDIRTPHVLTVIVNADDRLMIEGEEDDLTTLPDRLRQFVTDPVRTPKQAVVSLVHDRSSSYGKYVEVYDAVLAGYAALRDDYARVHYGKRYAFLSDARRADVRRAIPMIISEAEPNDALALGQ